jgi:hypothetical protein
VVLMKCFGHPNLASRILGVWERVANGLPKVSPGPAMLDPSTPCVQTTPKTALRPYTVSYSLTAAGGLWLSSTPLDSSRLTPIVN